MTHSKRYAVRVIDNTVLRGKNTPFKARGKKNKKINTVFVFFKVPKQGQILIFSTIISLMISASFSIFMAFTAILMAVFLFITKNSKKPATALSSVGPKNPLKVTLVERQKISHDTFNFVF